LFQTTGGILGEPGHIDALPLQRLHPGFGPRYHQGGVDHVQQTVALFNRAGRHRFEIRALLGSRQGNFRQTAYPRDRAFQIVGDGTTSWPQSSPGCR
jgi:hypothetical protein